MQNGLFQWCLNGCFCHFSLMCQIWKCLAWPQCSSGGGLARPTTAFGRLNSAAVESDGQGHSKPDGSSGRTIVKQGMTLRTAQRDLARGKFQPWALWVCLPFWCVYSQIMFSVQTEIILLTRSICLRGRRAKTEHQEHCLDWPNNTVVSLLSHAFICFAVGLLPTHVLTGAFFLSVLTTRQNAVNLSLNTQCHWDNGRPMSCLNEDLPHE